MEIISTFDAATYDANGFDSLTEEPAGAHSTVRFLAAAAKRGARGMRVTIDGAGNEAYVTKTGALSLALGETKFIGFWAYVPTAPSVVSAILDIGTVDFAFRVEDDRWKVLLKDDGAASRSAADIRDLTGAWQWVVLEVTRSTADPDTSGKIALWIDGIQTATTSGHNNDAEVGSGALDLRIGISQLADDGFIVDIDDLVVASTRPAPPTDGGLMMMGVG